MIRNNPVNNEGDHHHDTQELDSPLLLPGRDLEILT
jgi:hypothetical protein